MSDPTIIEGFEDLVLIGQGGFGAVYRGTQEHIGRTVAIKVLARMDPSDTKSRDRFLRETRAMGTLSRVPNVADIYLAQVTADGRPYLVMPYYAGGSLADHLATKGPLASSTVADIGSKVARALDQAHRAGITHRDIKPGNVLVDEYGEPFLTDFGLAITATNDASTRTRLSMTPEHAPPERLTSDPGAVVDDTLGDIYSLASTLWMLLDGSPPFGREQDVGAYPLIRRIVEEPVGPMRRSDVPPHLTEVLSKALAKRPGDRYPTAGVFATELAAIAGANPPPLGPLAPTLPRPEGPGSAVGPAPGEAAGDGVGLGADPPRPVVPLAGAQSSGLSDHTRVVSPHDTGAGPGPSSQAGPDNLPTSSSVPTPLQAVSADEDQVADGVTIYRPPEVRHVTEEQSPTEARRSPIPVAVGVIAATVLLVAVAFVVLRQTGTTAPNSTTTVPVQPGTAPVATIVTDVQPPVVTEVNALNDGGLGFKWHYADGTGGAPPVLYKVLVDNKLTKTDVVKTNSDGTPKAEVFLTADEVGSAPAVDPAKHQYCVSLAILDIERRGATPESPGVCAQIP